MEDYRLGERRLRTLGVEVSKIRETLRNQALKMDQQTAADLDVQVESISRLAMRASRGYYKPVDLERRLAQPDIEVDIAPGKRRRSRKRGALRLEEKIEIM